MTGRYFVTDEAIKVRRYDTRQRGLELKKQVATIDSELKEFADAWRKMADTLRDSSYNTFRIMDDERVEVRRPISEVERSRGFATGKIRTIAAVELKYFDRAELVKLLEDLEDAKRELRQISEQCAAMGDPLPF